MIEKKNNGYECITEEGKVFFAETYNEVYKQLSEFYKNLFYKIIEEEENNKRKEGIK